MNAVLERDRGPVDPPWGRAFGFAIAVHGLLVGLLAFGVAWKTSEPATIEAELWSTLPQVAAPAPPPPEPTPADVTPVPPDPLPRAAPQPVPDEPKPDIALEQERRRIEEERRQDELKQRRLDDERRAAEQRRRDAEAAAEKKREADAKRARDEAEQKKLAQQKAQDEQRRKSEFERNVARLSAQANVPASGTAPVTAGPKGDPTYSGRVAQIIRGNTTFAEAAPTEIARAEFAVELDPAGYVQSIRKTKSSGNPTWDAAVERAIKKSEPFPADKSGRVPSALTITHCPTC